MKSSPLFYFLCCLLPLFSCSPRLSDDTPSKDLVLSAGIPIGDMQPYSSKEGIGSNLIDLLYRPLFRIDSGGKLVPEFALSLVWDEKNNSLKVTVPAGTAEDVKKSIEKAKSVQGGGYSEALVNLREIVVSGDSQVVFALSKFDRAFLSVLEHLPIVLYSKPIQTSGDFEVESQTSDMVVLKRKQSSRAKINRIQLKTIPSPRRAIRELVAGNIDVLMLANRGDYEVLKDIPELSLGEIPTNILYFVLENRNGTAAGPFADWNKISRSFDRSQFLKSLERYSLRAAVDSNPNWPEASEPRGALPEPSALPRDERTLTFLGNQPRDMLVARLLKRHLEDLGVHLNLEAVEPQRFGEEVLYQKKFQWVLLPLNIKDVIVTNFLVFHSPQGANSLNYSGYSNLEVDSNLEKARYTLDEGQANEALSTAMAALRQDPPGLFLFWLKTPIVYRQSCSGFKFSSNEFFSSLKDVRCEPSVAN